ncbi:MAG: hypothetical protein JRF33_03345 [Deltaproteobacteria bacterium]|nr:hypothetical protein [Deltaproteobacteria bacterium]
MHAETHSPLRVILLVFIFGWSAIGSATEAPKNHGKPSPSDWLPSKIDDEGLRERWTFEALDSAGNLIQAELRHSNQGLNDHKAAFSLLHTDPEGKQTTCRGISEPGTWSGSLDAATGEATGEARIKMGRAQARLGLERQKLSIHCPEMKVDLDFQNLEPAWQPKFFADGAGSLTLLNPRGKVKGRIELKDKNQEFSGLGWITHQRSDEPAHRLWRRRIQIRGTGKHASLHCEILDLKAKHDARQETWCILADDKGLRLASTRLVWQLSAFIRDDSQGPDVIMPRRLRASIDGAKIDVMLGALRGKEDPAAKLGRLSRSASRMSNKAYDYFFDCVFSVKLQTEVGPFEPQLSPGRCRIEFNGT